VRIIPVASGKGGVGKSLVSANLSIALAKKNKKVILVDLDLGGSNLHLILGIRGLPEGLGTFLSGTSEFSDIIFPTEFKNLSFIAGDAEIPEMANLKNTQKNKIVRHLKALKCDYLILDLGAGTSFNTMDFFLLSQHSLIITTPALTSSMNAYLFLKNALFRAMVSHFKKDSVAGKLLTKLKKDGSSLQRLYIPKLLQKIQELDPENYINFEKWLKKFHPQIIFNMIEKPKDLDRAKRVRVSVRQYLGLDMQSLGVIYRDEVQDIALSSRLPVIIYKPNSVISEGINRIADKIIEQESFIDNNENHFILNEEDIEDSFHLTASEAESDYQTKLNYIEDLFKVGSLTMGDALEIMKNQQFEIKQLKQQNLLFKNKLRKASELGFKI